jgi:hypothetical protein
MAREAAHEPARSEPTMSFYTRWIVANGAAEALGLGATLALAGVAARALEAHPGAWAIVGGALVAVSLGVLLEGVLVGLAQAWALRSRIAGLSVRDWTLASALGAGAAWLLGMVPSTLMALLEPAASGATPAAAEPPAWIVYPAAAAMGLVLGPVLGLAQVHVLRRHVQRPLRWLWANALAWALGMVLVFAGMDRVPWQQGLPQIVATVLLVCALAGLAVGAVNGWFALRMTQSPAP